MQPQRSNLTSSTGFSLLAVAMSITTIMFQVVQAAGDSSHNRQGGGSFLSDQPNILKVMREILPEDHHHIHHQSHQPVQGVHMALAGPEAMRVTWMIPGRVLPDGSGSSPSLYAPACTYWVKNVVIRQVKGWSYSYDAGMFNNTLNSAILDLSVVPCRNTSTTTTTSNNKSSTTNNTQLEQLCIKDFSYQCGDLNRGLSDVFHVHFHSDTAAPMNPGPQFAVVGDMGVPHGLKTIHSVATRMVNSATSTTIDTNSSEAGVQILLHAGDISYADHYNRRSHNNSWVWVDYMNSLQNVTAQLPYMTAPGNHEAQFDFAAYLNWLPMPYNASDSGSPFWFSFDYLGVHVLSFSTEHDFFPNSTQHRWMQQDLKRANENRARVPWVVVIGHRPLYCSSLVCFMRCLKEAPLYRSYLEDLLYESHVDVVIAGHNHQYERSYPVYRGNATQKNYLNPKAPVYIVNGAAGNPELNDPTFEPDVEWRAWYKVTMDTGFLLMTPSRSQLKFDYVMSDKNNIIDSFTILRK